MVERRRIGVDLRHVVRLAVAIQPEARPRGAQVPGVDRARRVPGEQACVLMLDSQARPGGKHGADRGGLLGLDDDPHGPEGRPEGGNRVEELAEVLKLARPRCDLVSSERQQLLRLLRGASWNLSLPYATFPCHKAKF